MCTCLYTRPKVLLSIAGYNHRIFGIQKDGANDIRLNLFQHLLGTLGLLPLCAPCSDGQEGPVYLAGPESGVGYRQDRRSIDEDVFCFTGKSLEKIRQPLGAEEGYRVGGRGPAASTRRWETWVLAGVALLRSVTSPSTRHLH